MKAEIERGDLVLTPSGEKATVLYLHKRTKRALVLYRARKERVAILVTSLQKLPESDRTERSRSTRSMWAAKKAMNG
jgi:hypothetical protein